VAGTWHQRFHASLKDVAREDYGRMMRQAIRDKKVGDALAHHFGERLEKMAPSKLQNRRGRQSLRGRRSSSASTCATARLSGRRLFGVLACFHLRLTRLQRQRL
jgi:hypothetical protein